MQESGGYADDYFESFLLSVDIDGHDGRDGCKSEYGLGSLLIAELASRLIERERLYLHQNRFDVGLTLV